MREAGSLVKEGQRGRRWSKESGSRREREVVWRGGGMGRVTSSREGALAPGTVEVLQLAALAALLPRAV